MGYGTLLGSVFYMTCVAIGNRLLVVCAWFFVGTYSFSLRSLNL